MAAHRALLLIDIQKGFDTPFWGARNNPDAEKKAGQLLNAWRQAGAPIIHIRHLSRNAGSPLHPSTGSGVDFKDEVTPLGGETVFEKSTNSAFIGAPLEAYLHEHGISDLVICGLTTPHCVSTTTRMAANLGFGVTLAHDACASFDVSADTTWADGLQKPSPQMIHELAVSHLHGEFCTALPADTILATLV